MPTPNSAEYAGSRFYRVIGDWALPNDSTAVEHAVSTANAIGAVPANAIAVSLRCSVSLKATGSAGATASMHTTTISIPLTAGGDYDQQYCSAIEGAGYTPGSEFASIPWQMRAYITNNIANPEFTLKSLITNAVIEKFAITGYWMP